MNLEQNAPRVEDREGSRLPFRLKVDYRTVDEFIIEYTENISRGGAFIRTRRPLQPGTRLQIEINIAGVPVFMKMRGKVAWINPPIGTMHRPDLPTGMGVHLIFPDESTRLMMEALVERLEQEPSEHKRDISPEYLGDILRHLRPDIQELVMQRRNRSPDLARHIDEILANRDKTPTEE